MPRGCRRSGQRLTNVDCDVQGRDTLFAMFGGKVPLRAALVPPGEKPYLIARVGTNRQVLLEAASAASCGQKW